MNAITDDMPPVQPFGALLDGILCRFAEAALFPPAASDSERKEAILSAYQRGDVTDRQAKMLIAHFRLASA